MILHQIFAMCTACAATVGLIGTIDGSAAPGADKDITTLAKRAADAHAHLMRGDVRRYRQSIEVAPDFMLMDPFGGAPTGAPQSDAHWERIGRFFRDGRDARFELLRAYRSADMVVLVANEHAHVAVGSLPAQDWSLRVTLVFRRDGREWRLAHRHADPLVNGLSLERAGRVTLGAPDA